MPSIHDTAYPRLKASVTTRDLAEVYTPTPEERTLAAELTRSRGVSSIGTGTSVKPFSFVNSTPRDHSASRIRREPRRLAQCCALFLPTQPLRRWFGLREAAAMPSAKSLRPFC